MKSQILKSEKNPFLSREEIIMELVCEAAPSAQDILGELKRDEKAVVIRKVHANFGRQTFLVDVLVYDSEEEKNKVEVIPKKIRKKMEEERKAAEEQAKKEAAEKAKAEEEAKLAEAEKDKALNEQGSGEEATEADKPEEAPAEEKTEDKTGEKKE